MAMEALLLTSSSLLILLLQLLLFQTSVANKPYDCTPSACGIFSNISSPLRLKGDPKHCGDFELACENNVTAFYFNSHKFYVKEINYTYPATMRVVDASINNDICSFPTATYNYDYDPLFSKMKPINYMSCPHPLKNSSGFTETTPCQIPNSRFTYIKVGRMMAFEVPETCRVDVVTMTSWRGFKDFKNALLGEEINSALLYGFEINIYTWYEDTKWEGGGRYCGRRRRRRRRQAAAAAASSAVEEEEGGGRYCGRRRRRRQAALWKKKKTTSAAMEGSGGGGNRAAAEEQFNKFLASI